LLLQVKVEQTDKQLQEMQDSKSKGQKTKQKHQVSTELGYQQAIPKAETVCLSMLAECDMCL